jgi:membrane-associated phospholipid phosphatase
VPAGSSWPSGHSAVAAATATSLSPHPGPLSRLVAGGFVGTVAVSRLYVGVHHLTDVVAGVAVGHLCARAVRGGRRAIWGPRTRRATRR